ncbi:MAG: hypothetical protein ACKOCC_05945 [Actinomycetota bacterium]
MSLPGEMSRRRFLGVGAAVGFSAVVAACGGEPSGGSSPTEIVPDLEGALQIVKRFPPKGLVPGQVRLPVSLADSRGILGNDGTRTFPDSLAVTILDPSTGGIVTTAVATRHGDDLSVPYWPVVIDIDSPGIYSLRLDAAAKDSGGASRGNDVSFQVDAPDTVAMPVPGRALLAFDTPTISNPRGVSPICTRAEGPCPFHEVTLTEALARGVPVVYLVGTPAHCTSGTCAPALESLIAVASDIGDRAVFVHADIYADEAATTVAPAITALKMQFEPALFVTDARGTVATRLDVVFDADEIRGALATAGLR